MHNIDYKAKQVSFIIISIDDFKYILLTRYD